MQITVVRRSIMALLPGNEDNEISNINITPMVDVMLVLLVIFMVTANFLKKESININLPKVGASDPNVAQSIQIALTKEGKILMEGVEVDQEKLISKLSWESKFRPNMRVTLSADERLPYGTIAKIMGNVRKAGVFRIALSVKR
jgi:biopolymer transport protein ExbD